LSVGSAAVLLGSGSQFHVQAAPLLQQGSRVVHG
jgi:hypothetical protein